MPNFVDFFRDVFNIYCLTRRMLRKSYNYYFRLRSLLLVARSQRKLTKMRLLTFTCFRQSTSNYRRFRYKCHCGHLLNFVQQLIEQQE